MVEKKDSEVSFAVVLEALPNTLFRLKLEGKDQEIIAYLSGKMRLNKIRVMIGDKVEILLDQYGGKARIIRRLDNKR